MVRVVVTTICFVLAVVSFWAASWPGIEELLPIAAFAGLHVSFWFMIAGVLLIFVCAANAFTIGDAIRRTRDKAGRQELKMVDADVALAYEKVEPLTEKDRGVLQREFRLLMIVLAMFSLAPVALLFVVDESDHAYIYAFMLPWLGILVYFGGKAHTRKESILETGTKNVIRGIITDRFYKYHQQKGRHIRLSERSTISIPHFRIGDRELWVSNRIFARFKVGEAVEFHYCETGLAYNLQTNVFLSARVIEGASLAEAAK